MGELGQELVALKFYEATQRLPHCDEPTLRRTIVNSSHFLNTLLENSSAQGNADRCLPPSNGVRQNDNTKSLQSPVANHEFSNASNSTKHDASRAAQQIRCLGQIRLEGVGEQAIT